LNPGETILHLRGGALYSRYRISETWKKIGNGSALCYNWSNLLWKVFKASPVKSIQPRQSEKDKRKTIRRGVKKAWSQNVTTHRLIRRKGAKVRNRLTIREKLGSNEDNGEREEGGYK